MTNNEIKYELEFTAQQFDNATTNEQCRTASIILRDLEDNVGRTNERLAYQLYIVWKSCVMANSDMVAMTLRLLSDTITCN